MSEPEHHARESEDELTPEQGNTPENVASEQFVHGLLVFLHRDDEAAQDARVKRAVAALEEPAPVVHVLKWRPSWRAISSVAALLLISALIVFFSIETQQSAHALVQATLQASRDAGDRRYAIRVKHPHESEPGEPIAFLDVRDRQHVVFRAITPEGHALIVGRNAEGEWVIRPDGSIQRFDTEGARPRWINLGESTLLIESIDNLLAQLGEQYELTRANPAPLGGDTGPDRVFERIVAQRIATDSPQPEHIELWIDRDTLVVQRVELTWNRELAQERRDDRRPPADRPRRNDGPPPGERPQRFDGPPPGERPPHDGPPQRRAQRPRPRLLDGPPRFGEGDDSPPPPPEVVIFDLVDGPPFDDAWFAPETHQP